MVKRDLKRTLDVKDAITILNTVSRTQKMLKREPLIKSGLKIPICVNCDYCEQRGFLWSCTIHEEDVGIYGLVYYKRKNHKPKIYAPVPMKSTACKDYKPLLLGVLE